MAPHSSALPGRRSLVGCSPRGRTESDPTEATWQQQQQQALWVRGPGSTRAQGVVTESIHTMAAPSMPNSHSWAS